MCMQSVAQRKRSEVPLSAGGQEATVVLELGKEALFSLAKYPEPHPLRVGARRAVKVSGSGMFEQARPTGLRREFTANPVGFLSGLLPRISVCGCFSFLFLCDSPSHPLLRICLWDCLCFPTSPLTVSPSLRMHPCVCLSFPQFSVLLCFSVCVSPFPRL